ncbi:MAG: phospho-N-acetylmuramoyl-pentapeptide-transferase [Candidatus Kerfeldbacteria bacterium]|nr:phospho-N-acetylmuramoyl-pentapeptide-transferase [Candidatus Kerfeldbacteria bacterium]
MFLTSASFILAFACTPVLTHFLYRYRLGKNIRDDLSKTPVFAKLHAHKQGTPTMGGVLIWGTTAFLAGLFALLPLIMPNIVPPSLSFLSRSETLLPLGALVLAALVGLADDFLNIRRIGENGGGMKMMERLGLFTIIALIAAYWFTVKLQWTIIDIPFYGNVEIGWWTFPIFVFVIVATSFSVNETDGLDGLAGGVLLASFAAFGAIAYIQGHYDLATFCAVIAGSLLAFLWFNIHPARFYMGDTGSMSLGVTLGVVAMLTNTVWLLPIIGSILVAESVSVIIQITSKKLRKGKKVFISTPIHHHFEAIGWQEPKIVMRFWIISAVSAVLGIVLFLIERAQF